MEYLSTQGVDVGGCNDAGDDSALWATSTGQIKVLQWLWDHGYDLRRARNKRGTTPLLSAVSYTENMELVEWLVSHGARLDDRNTGNQGLEFYARANNDKQVLDFVQRAKMMTPLQACCLLHNTDGIRFLLSQGWDPHVTLGVSPWSSTLDLVRGPPLRLVERAVTLLAEAVILAARTGFTPGRHLLFGPRFRARIHLLLLIRCRLRRFILLPDLPLELWYDVFGFLPRDTNQAVGLEVPIAEFLPFSFEK